jgi:hypothetical protein
VCGSVVDFYDNIIDTLNNVIVDLKFPFFWDMVPHHLVIGTQCFGTAWSFIFKSQKSMNNFLPLKMGPICCLKRLDTNHSVTWHHITEQRPLTAVLRRPTNSNGSFVGQVSNSAAQGRLYHKVIQNVSA